MIIIKIATDFSPTPGARYRTDGPFSGEQFREEKLLPLFEDKTNTDKIIIDLDGAEGYPSSFLEEAFGGLARIVGSEKVRERIEFQTKEFTYMAQKTLEFIDNAEN